MSFFDDASLAFLPSGGAGKDGKAYSIKPVPEYGSEEVTNGDFATDSDWVKGAGVTISGEKCECLNTTPYNYALSQIIQLTVNKTYLVSYEILDYVSGEIRVRLGSNMGTTRSSNGVYQENIVAQNTDFILQTVASSFTGSIDNVSVKEVLVDDGDFTFSRGSNLAATRVGPTGLIEKGRENLLTYSNEFDTTWVKSNASVTSGHAGYDGSTDAWKLIQNTTNTFHFIYENVSVSSICTLSIYAKAGEYSGISFFFPNVGGTSTATTFNLSTGTFVNNTHNATAESVGNGWYRISLLSKPSGSQNFNIYVNQTTQQSEAGDGTSGIYIQDAQLEIGLAATEVIESGATTGKAGLLEDEPRFDYSGGATCPSLLLEPSRTQLVTQTEYFGASSWVKQNCTITSNYAISPEGVNNASRIVSSGVFFLYQLFTFTNAVEYTLSFYVKSNGSGNDSFRLYAEGNSATKTATNEWVRHEYTFTGQGTNKDFGLRDVGGSSLDILIWGAQLEQGSYPTSYIPNHSGGSVTRGYDYSNLLNIDTNIVDITGDFTFFVDNTGSLIKGTEVFHYFIVLFWDAVTNIRYYSTSNGSWYYRPDNAYAGHTNSVGKQIIKYENGVFYHFLNGNKSASTLTMATTNSLSQIQFFANTGGRAGYLDIKQALLFDTALSDADCITLTTL